VRGANAGDSGANDKDVDVTGVLDLICGSGRGCSRRRHGCIPARKRGLRQGGRPGLTATFVRENLRFVETYEAVLDALGDRTRRQIVRHLRMGPMSVGELAAAMPVSRPAVSQHLTVLRRSGLVSYSELGTRNLYRLDPAGLSELRAWLDGFWETALDRYARRVREDGDGSGPQPRP
jgi:DNA-binding transcriptional ArsR family regulator